MKFRTTLAFASTLALAACGSNTATNAAADAGNLAAATHSKVEDTAGAVVGAASAPLVNTADAYVAAAATGDMYELESSKLALEKSQSPAVKKFAQQMITDHTATTAKLKAAIAQAGLNLAPPAELDARRAGMLDNLRNATSAADFDKAYLDQQTAAHQEALTVHTSFAEDGDNDVLKKLAAETAPKIQHHFDMVKQLDAGGAEAAH
jgi:putative membrane protein